MEKFPVFKQGDPASKLLNHNLLNNAFSMIGSLGQTTIGRPSIGTGPASYMPSDRPPVEVVLAKVLGSSASTATGSFAGPTGEVEVFKVEKIDAVFEETVGTQQITQLDASTRVVYAAAPAGFTSADDSYVWIARWSHQWWILTGAGGGVSAAAGVIKFVVDSASSAIGQGAIGCDFVDAIVTHVGCNYTAVNVGDTVRIWDPDFCYFNIPISLLTYLRGTAQLMDNPVTAYDLQNLVDCQYEVLSAGSCRWVVTGVCCAEEYAF
jgi:hypothetical protein